MDQSTRYSDKIFIKLTLFVLIVAVLYSFAGLRSSIDKSIDNVYAHVKGQAAPDSNIVLITIDSNDIDNLGPWPIKRSYYALLIKSLSAHQVKAIGLEVFLSAKFVTQSIYDNLLTKEIQKSGRVVIGSIAGKIYKSNGKYFTDSLSYPSPKLLDENIKTGHLNYFASHGIDIPLFLHNQNKIEKSFSLELAQQEFDYVDGSLLHVNFVSSWKNFKHYSLLQYFRLVEKNSNELDYLKGKTVLIGITDPQLAQTIQTNFDDSLPGVALHAFALDNILLNRQLNNSFYTFTGILFVVLILILILLQLQKKIRINMLIYSVIFLSFVVITFILRAFFEIQFSYALFFIPFFGIIIIDLTFFLLEKQNLLTSAIDETEALKLLLNKKELELQNLQKELNVSAGLNAQNLAEKIKILKADIDKLKESEDDKSEAEILGLSEAVDFQGIIYKSRAMNKVVDLIKRAAPEDASILILGESGTGKELVANAIHQLSKRKELKFVAVNCGALADTLLESELFGHIKGAFTGAVADKIGRFEAADKGTIFLDEIAETSENFQIKLLRVIQSGDFEKVGSSKTSHANVRIVAATNKILEDLVKERKFREDLYYRLNVIKIDIPPLRDRKEDILILTDYFLKAEGDYTLSKAASESLVDYEWKGNVRELEAVMKRAVIFAKSAGRKLIQLVDLPENIVKNSKLNFEDLVIESLRDKKFSHSAITETAKELGNVSRTIVSENYRGYALKAYAENDYNFEEAIQIIAATDDEEAKVKVSSKLHLFIKNIENDVEKLESKSFEEIKDKLNSKYKNLPQKFHIYLDEIIKRKISS